MSSSKLNSRIQEVDKQTTGKEVEGVDPMDATVDESSLLY